LGHERELQKKFCVVSAKARGQNETSAQHQAVRVSSDVAEVAKRPKNRPGSRERSSITMGATRRVAVLA
jgi:hypothetical protein